MTPAEIKATFAALAEQFYDPANRCWKQYDLANEMIALSTAHYNLTGEYLNREDYKPAQQEQVK